MHCRTEHIDQSQKRDATIRASEAAPQTNNQAAEPLKIPGITYHEINFNGKSFQKMLISKITWLELFRLIFLMLFGYRLQAIAILTPSMEKSGVSGLAIDSLDVCKSEVREYFDVLSVTDNYPVMVHCTQGKDRTGLTVMLVLFLLGVPTEAIEADYALSDSELINEREERIKDMAKVGLSERFARCSPGLAGKVEQHIKEKYGGIEGYLDFCGVTREVRAKVKETLLYT